jgi:hypothetical protein
LGGEPLITSQQKEKEMADWGKLTNWGTFLGFDFVDSNLNTDEGLKLAAELAIGGRPARGSYELVINDGSYWLAPAEYTIHIELFDCSSDPIRRQPDEQVAPTTWREYLAVATTIARVLTDDFNRFIRPELTIDQVLILVMRSSQDELDHLMQSPSTFKPIRFDVVLWGAHEENLDFANDAKDLDISDYRAWSVEVVSRLAARVWQAAYQEVHVQWQESNLDFETVARYNKREKLLQAVMKGLEDMARYPDNLRTISK